MRRVSDVHTCSTHMYYVTNYVTFFLFISSTQMIKIVFIDKDFQIGWNASLLGNKLPQSFSLSINLELLTFHAH